STWTMVPDQGSDLINSIPVSDCDANYDQRDVEREQDYACDAGAVETFEPIYLSIATPGGLTQIRILNAVSVLDGGSMPTASLPSGLPAGVAFPYGGMTLELDVWGRGWPVDID